MLQLYIWVASSTVLPNSSYTTHLGNRCLRGSSNLCTPRAATTSRKEAGAVFLSEAKNLRGVRRLLSAAVDTW